MKPPGSLTAEERAALTCEERLQMLDKARPTLLEIRQNLLTPFGLLLDALPSLDPATLEVANAGHSVSTALTMLEARLAEMRNP